MSDERIKDVNGGVTRALVPTDVIPIDSTAGGTGISTPSGVVLAAGYPIPRPPFDDFDGSGIEWTITALNGATAKLAPSATPEGMPSRGIALLACTTTSGSKVTLIRAATGLVLGATSPIVIAWRFMATALPSDSTTAELILGVLSDDTHAVAVDLSLNNTGVAAAALLTATGGAPASEAIAWPAGSYFDVRLTIRETGTTVEVAADDGPFATLLTGVNAPSHNVYGPWAQLDRVGTNGSAEVAIDSCDPSASRLASDGGAPADQSTPFKVGFPGFGTNSITACVGNDARLSDARAPTGAAGGALAGTYPNPTLAAGVLASNEYAPAFTNVHTNISTPAAAIKWQWLRIGAELLIHGTLTVDIGTPSSGHFDAFDVSLPVAITTLRHAAVVCLNQDAVNPSVEFDMTGYGTLQTSTTVRVRVDRWDATGTGYLCSVTIACAV